jgi:hypothetical protein
MFLRKKLALSSMTDSFIKRESSKKSISSMLTTLPGKAKGNTEEIRSPRIQTPNNRPSWISIFIERYNTLPCGFCEEGPKEFPSSPLPAILASS